MENMEIICIYGYNYDSNIYLIKGKNPTLVDCGTGFNNNEITKEIKTLIDPSKIKQIILTHEHFDHCGGVKKIFDLTEENAKIIAHINASDKIESGESQFAQMLGGKMPKMKVDLKLKDGDILTIGDESFTTIHTPGHTPGCICLYSKSSKSLISGDTIFSHGSFGRYDFPGGNAAQLKESIIGLSKLDVENLYPGHESIVEGNGNRHIEMTVQNTQYLI